MGFINDYGGNTETMAHSGIKAVERAREAGLSDLQIINIAQAEGISFGPAAQSSLLAGVSASQAAAQQQQQAQAAAQQRQFQEQIAAFQAQMAAQQRQYEAQITSLKNIQNSQVPAAEATAQDSSTPEQSRPASGGRTLTSLAIIEGLGTNNNPLAGLQLA